MCVYQSEWMLDCLDKEDEELWETSSLSLENLYKFRIGKGENCMSEEKHLLCLWMGRNSVENSIIYLFIVFQGDESCIHI